MIEAIINPPKQLPIDLQEVKDTLRISDKSENPRLLSMIKSATTWIEKLTQKAFITQTRKSIIYLSHSQQAPHSMKRIRVPLPTLPLRRMIKVLFQEEEVESYSIQGGQYLCLPHFFHPGELSFHYEVGYGPNPEDVPAPLRQAILISVTNYYEDMVFPPFKKIKHLINPYRSLSIH